MCILTTTQVESVINTRTILQKTPEVARAMITGARQVCVYVIVHVLVSSKLISFVLCCNTVGCCASHTKVL
jgi:hypothetical protein